MKVRKALTTTALMMASSMTPTTLRNTLLISAITLGLTACGGGSGNSSTPAAPTPPTPVAPVTPSDPVTLASNATATQLGVTPVPGNTATAQVFDLTADIGDTWRLTLNKDDSFSIKVLSTQYALTDISSTYTQTTSGNFVSFIGANNSFDLELDKRTQTIVGLVNIGGKSSTVAGTGYSAPANTSTLAGTYVFEGDSRNAVGGGVPTTLGGTMLIAANGIDMTVCASGQVTSNGTCTSISITTPTSPQSLTIVRNSNDGLLHVQQDGGDFGILNVQAGDRGPVLLFDRFGYNQDTPPVLRTGVLYAVKQQTLTGTELNGTWACSDHGTTVGTIAVNGSTAQTTPVTTGVTQAESINYNNANDSSGLLAFNGFTTLVTNGDTNANGVLFLPLSSSLAVVEQNGTNSVATCRVKN